MSEQNREFESSLQQHYQRQKAAVNLPGELKKTVLAKAKRVDKSHPRERMGQQLGLWALAATVVVTLYFMIRPTHQSEPQQEVTYIEYHGFDQTQQLANSNSRSFQDYTQELQDKTQLFQAKRLQARLAVQTNGTWQLETCRDRALHLSQELVAMLQAIDRVPQITQPDTPIDVYLAQNGQVLQIQARDEPMICD